MFKKVLKQNINIFIIIYNQSMFLRIAKTCTVKRSIVCIFNNILFSNVNWNNKYMNTNYLLPLGAYTM